MTAIFCFANHSQWDIQGETKNTVASSGGDQPEQCNAVLRAKTWRCWEYVGHPKQTHQNEEVAKVVGKRESQSLLLLLAQAIRRSRCNVLETKQCVLRHLTGPTNPGRWCNEHETQGFRIFTRAAGATLQRNWALAQRNLQVALIWTHMNTFAAPTKVATKRHLRWWALTWSSCNQADQSKQFSDPEFCSGDQVMLFNGLESKILKLLNMYIYVYMLFIMYI